MTLNKKRARKIHRCFALQDKQTTFRYRAMNSKLSSLATSGMKVKNLLSSITISAGHQPPTKLQSTLAHAQFLNSIGQKIDREQSNLEAKLKAVGQNCVNAKRLLEWSRSRLTEVSRQEEARRDQLVQDQWSGYRSFAEGEES